MFLEIYSHSYYTVLNLSSHCQLCNILMTPYEVLVTANYNGILLITVKQKHMALMPNFVGLICIDEVFFYLL